MRERFDRSSKWLIQHHGDSIVRLAGAGPIRSWRPLQAELVQPRQLPDGLLEVTFANQPQPDLFLVEVATYAERRVSQQMVRDVAMVLLDRGTLPEVLTLVLRPKGKLRVPASQKFGSRLGLAHVEVSWRVIELWT